MFNIISLLIRYSNSFILNNYWSRVWVVCWNGISWGWTIFTLDAQKSFFYRLFCFLLYGLSSVLLLNIWGKRFEKAKNKESRCWPREVESDWQNVTQCWSFIHVYFVTLWCYRISFKVIALFYVKAEEFYTDATFGSDLWMSSSWNPQRQL